VGKKTGPPNMAGDDAGRMDTPFAGTVSRTEHKGRTRARLASVSVFRLRWHPVQPSERHSDANVEELMRSIEEMGLLEPPLVWKKDDGTLVVLAGHRRVRGWQLLVQAGFFNNDRIRVFIMTDLTEGQAAVIMAAEYGHRRECSPVHTALLIGKAREQLLAEEDGRVTVRRLAAVLPWGKSSIDDYLDIYRALQDPELGDFVHLMDKMGKRVIHGIVTAEDHAMRVEACKAFQRDGAKAARKVLAAAKDQPQAVRVTGLSKECDLTYNLTVSLRPDLKEAEIAAIESAFRQVEEHLVRIRAASE
jgi:ParB/RepB/Spo0J family partition protein